MLRQQKATIQFTDFYKIPTWAIYALVYGVDNDDSLSKEDLNDLLNFLESENLQYHSLELPKDIDSEKYFTYSPSFGLGSEVVDCRFYK